MKIAIILYFIILSIITFYLLYLNRANEILWAKFLPALAVGLTVACFFTWFSLKEDEINNHFPITYISSQKSLQPLEKIDLRYSTFYGGKLFKPRSFLVPDKNQELWDFHFDIATIEIAETIYETYQELKNKPGTNIFSSSKFPISLDLQRRSMNWEEFINHFKKSDKLKILFESINTARHSAYNTTFPTNTSLSFIDDPHKREIFMSNDFCDFKIILFKNSGHAGLGEWKWLLNYTDEVSENFWQSFIILEISAKFNKLRFGHPDKPKYVKWVENIQTNLDDNYNYNTQLKNAKEYYHLFKDRVNTFFNKDKK